MEGGLFFFLALNVYIYIFPLHIFFFIQGNKPVAGKRVLARFRARELNKSNKKLINKEEKFFSRPSFLPLSYSLSAFPSHFISLSIAIPLSLILYISTTRPFHKSTLARARFCECPRGHLLHKPCILHQTVKTPAIVTHSDTGLTHTHTQIHFT